MTAHGGRRTAVLGLSLIAGLVVGCSGASSSPKASSTGNASPTVRASVAAGEASHVLCLTFFRQSVHQRPQTGPKLELAPGDTRSFSYSGMYLRFTLVSNDSQPLD